MRIVSRCKDLVKVDWWKENDDIILRYIIDRLGCSIDREETTFTMNNGFINSVYFDYDKSLDTLSRCLDVACGITLFHRVEKKGFFRDSVVYIRYSDDEIYQEYKRVKDEIDEIIDGSDDEICITSKINTIFAIDKNKK